MLSKRWKDGVRTWLIRRGAFVDGPFWAISIYEGPSPLRLRPVPGSAPALGARDVTDVDAKFVADPFMLRQTHGWHLFFEVLNRDRAVGEIGLASSPDGVHWDYEQVVLSAESHLSYPYVFPFDGEVFMVPETCSEHEVRLYRATDYPRRWEIDTVLLTGRPYKDASVFLHEDRWWMYVETSTGPRFDTLRLFTADRLRGPWREHASSPVCLDASAARPAGRVLRYEGQPLRFAQDCSHAYGRSVNAHLVTELADDSYVEHPTSPASILAPAPHGWNDAGMHHVDAHEVTPGRWLACVDGRPATGLRRPPLLPPAQRPTALYGRRHA